MSSMLREKNGVELEAGARPKSMRIPHERLLNVILPSRPLDLPFFNTTGAPSSAGIFRGCYERLASPAARRR